MDESIGAAIGYRQMQQYGARNIQLVEVQRNGTPHFWGPSGQQSPKQDSCRPPQAGPWSTGIFWCDEIRMIILVLLLSCRSMCGRTNAWRLDRAGPFWA
jgi:hypothetical protein